MNPYEALPIDTKTPRSKKPSIQWKAIVTAFLVQLAGSIFLVVLLNHETQMPELIFLGICFGIPYVGGAACLSSLVKSNWIMHGLIYASICPMLLLVLLASNRSAIGILLGCEFFAVLLTLSTMAILRNATANRPA